MAHTDADERLAAEFFCDSTRPTALAGVDVVEDHGRVRLVYHDPDGAWWFSSGGDDEDEELLDVCLPCLLHDDPNLVEVADLKRNWIAELDELGVWRRQPRPADWGPWDPDAEPPVEA
jgi:hypothetical protein